MNAVLIASSTDGSLHCLTATTGDGASNHDLLADAGRVAVLCCSTAREQGSGG
jgi:hypothetical protein